jgi:arginine utilization protein RocB
MLWQSAQQLEDLVCKLVSIDSRTGTKGEVLFPYRLKDELLQLDYFKNHPENIEFHDAGKERNTLTALYKSPNATKTIVFISHFDTVHTAEFGAIEDLAYKPHELTEYFKKTAEDFKAEIKADIESGEFLFGRGIMDMKMGLVLQMHLIEQAIIEEWPINLLLTAVPDEEVDSAGMRAAARRYEYLREKHELEYTLMLNCEPSFTQRPNDQNYYIYTGSIGKIMPSALFYGVETHAGEPLKGLNANYMASFLNQRMEFNDAFKETCFGETTPLPITLKTYDLKADYSTQTTNHVASLYNVFLMEQSEEKVFNTFNKITHDAAVELNTQYEEMCERENVSPVGTVNVMTYEALKDYTVSKIGEDKVNELITKYAKQKELDDRTQSFEVVNSFINQCKELVPIIVTFFAPPYYPSVNNSDHPVIKDIVSFTKDELQKNNADTQVVHYFNGISDLSYVTYDADDESYQTYIDNTPMWGQTYTVPFNDMQKLQAPFINIGPFGKDAHKISERLHKTSAFESTPRLLSKLIKRFFAE